MGKTATTTTTSATVTGLTNGTAYTFTVTATNAAGTGPTSAASAPVTPVKKPSPPQHVAATAGDRQATVTWGPPSAADASQITGYTVTSQPDARIATVTAGQTTATVTGLTNGRAYTFTVVATLASGTTDSSAASNQVTPAGPPGAVSWVAATSKDGSAQVSWGSPADTGGFPVTSYTVAAPGIAAVVVAGTTTTTTSGCQRQGRPCDSGISDDHRRPQERPLCREISERLRRIPRAR